MLNQTIHQAVVAAPADVEKEAKLIAVLKSEAGQKEKADAFRELALCASRESVGVLASFLDKEEYSHMARYALEPIPDPAVDDVLRNALSSLKGRLLVGVIGSLGVRRGVKAVEKLIPLLKDGDADVAQAAARALGSIGTADAAEAIESALASTPKANQLAFCEGLFRSAEALAAQGFQENALAIYQRLNQVEGIHQVKTGAECGLKCMQK